MPALKWLKLLALRFANSEWEALQQGIEAKKALEDERRARAALEITSASLLRENEFLREEARQARKGERDALRLICNLGLQKLFGFKPFPAEVGLPEYDTQKPEEQPGSARVHGIDMVNKARETFMDELAKREARGEHIPVDREVLAQALHAI